MGRSLCSTKDFGWPTIEYNELEDLISIIRQQGTKGFQISSSYGMRGWVLARSMELTQRGARAID
jgi:hypothetical protein